jgi:hypothetical protein
MVPPVAIIWHTGISRSAAETAGDNWLPTERRSSNAIPNGRDTIFIIHPISIRREGHIAATTSQYIPMPAFGRTYSESGR